jgi:hypothetical protein
MEIHFPSKAFVQTLQEGFVLLLLLLGWVLYCRMLVSQVVFSK